MWQQNYKINNLKLAKGNLFYFINYLWESSLQYIVSKKVNKIPEDIQ